MTLLCRRGERNVLIPVFSGGSLEKLVTACDDGWELPYDSGHGVIGWLQSYGDEG